MLEKKGVTLILLVIAIIVLGIFIGIITVDMKNNIAEAGLREFTMEINQLEYLIKQYKYRNSGALDFQTYIINTSTALPELIEQMGSETVINGEIRLYKIDYDKIDAMQTKYGNKIYGENDLYLVSNDTDKVYYLKGYNSDGEIYYTITDEIRKELLLRPTN